MASVQDFRNIYKNTCDAFKARGKYPSVEEKGEIQLAKDRNFAVAYYALTHNRRHTLGHYKARALRKVSKNLPMFEKDKSDLKQTEIVLNDIDKFIAEKGRPPRRSGSEKNLAEHYYRIRDNYEYLDENNQHWG